MHDAVHDAVSPKRWVNRLLSRGMDFVGASSYLLRQLHGEHHKWVNIHGIDVTLETHGLFRFTPHETWKPIHRLQHIYIPILYPFTLSREETSDNNLNAAIMLFKWLLSLTSISIIISKKSSFLEVK